MPANVTLSKPLTTHKGEITEIELRDITAKDLVEMRVSPLGFTNIGSGIGSARVTDQRVELRYDIAMGYLVRLSGIDEILLGALQAKDFEKCVGAVTKLWNDAGE